MRKINTRLFVILVISVALFGGAIFGLHRLQAGNIADALLWQASQAEKDGKLDRAAKYLGRYLEFVRDDLETREQLGMILSDPRMATSPQRRARARFVIEQVLAKDPQRHELRQRLAETLIAGRSFDAAKEHLAYLEKNGPASAPVALLTGQWHEAQNRPSQAVDAYRKALKLDARLVDAYTRLVALLKHLDFGKEPIYGNEIESLVLAAMEKAPHDAAVLSLAAQHAQEKGNTRIALSYLEDGLKQNPAEPRLYLALARIHGENSKRADAIAMLRQGLEAVKKEHRFELRWSLANFLLDDNNLDEAKKIGVQIREVNPLSADYLDARAQMQRGRWFEASRQLEKLRPSLKNTQELAFQVDLYLGVCYEQLDEPMLQLAAYERAMQGDAKSLLARRGVVGARAALGQNAEALQIYHELIGLTKDAQESTQRRIEYVRFLLRTSASNTKEHKKIGEELDRLEKAAGKSMDAALLRAEWHFIQGDKAKAKELLEEIVQANPNRHEPWVSLLALADAKDGETLMQTAEERFKDKAEFRHAQIQYFAQKRDVQGDAALLRLENELMRFEPRERGPLLQALAEAHYYAGKYVDSARVLARVLVLPMHVQDVRIRMQMLELAFLQDDDVLARKVLDEIKRLEGDNAGGPDWSFGEAMRLIHAARKGKKDGLDAARHLLTVAAAQRPNWHPIIQVRADLDELQGRPDQAIANYRRAVDLGSRDPHAVKQLLILLSQAQRHDEVEQLLARMQKQQGTTDEIVRYYVAHTVNRRDFKKAEYLIRQIVASNSANYRDHLWMGQVLSMGGQNPDDAEKALRRAVALAPEQPEARIGLVRHLIGNGQHSAARTEIDNTKSALPADRVDSALAMCYELAGFLVDAAESHKAALEKQPASATVHRAAADFQMRVARFGEAEKLYRKLAERRIRASEDDVNAARRGLALALVRQNRPAKTTEALQIVGLAVDDNGLAPNTKFADAQDEHLLQGKLLGTIAHHRLRGAAITQLDTLQKKNALPPEDQFLLARLLVQQNPQTAGKGGDDANWIKARGLLATLIASQPKNPRFLQYAAQQLIHRHEYTEAEQMITRLETIERERKAMPGGFGSIELWAKMKEQRGLGTQAIALLTSYAEQTGASPVRKLLLANLHGRLGNYRDAVDLCEEVRQTGAHYNEANAAVVAILRTNKPSEAQPTKFDHWAKQRQRVESSLREAMQKDPKDAPVRLHLADLMEMQGKYDDVEKLCREVLKENENNLVALNNLAWLLGQKSNTAAEALTLIERAVAKYGQRPELLDTRAIVQLNLGRIEPALRDLQRVVNEAPTPTRLFHLCRVQERARNIPSAQAALRQANDLGLTAQQLHPVEQAEYQRVTSELARRN